MIRLAGGHLLHEDRFTGGYVLEEVMYDMMACFAGENVQLEFMYYEWTCILEIQFLKL